MIQETTVLSRAFSKSFIERLQGGVREKLGYRNGKQTMPEERLSPEERHAEYRR